MFPLPMEPRPASAGFPFAIRARLSTEDSGSDASSFIAGDSDDNSGIDGSEEEDEEETAEDNAASIGRPFMPIARITGDDEDDDAIDDLVFDDDDEEEEVNPKLAVEKLVANSSNAGVDEDFRGGFAAGREESGLFYGIEEKVDNLGDEGPVIVSEEGFRVQEKEKGFVEVDRMAAHIDDTGADEGGLELNVLKVGIDGSNMVHEVEEDLHFSTVVYEKIGAVGCEDVKQSKGFELELKDLVVESSMVDSENNNLVGDVHSNQNSVMEVELRALQAEAHAATIMIPDFEDDLVEISKIKASGAITSGQVWNEEAEAKTAETELSILEDMEEEAASYIDSKNGLVGEKMLEAGEVEDDSTDSEGFEATNAVAFSHSQILEMVSIHDSKAFEPKHPEVCAVHMEAEKDEALYRRVNSVDSEKAKDSFGKLLILTGSDTVHGNHSPSQDVSAQYIDNFKEKNDESRAVVKEASITENYSACDFSSDNFSSFDAYEKEMESSFGSFHVVHYEKSAEEDEHVISEWPARFVVSENSESVEHILKEMEKFSSSSDSSFETSQSYSHILDGQTISNSDEEGETDEDGNAKELFHTSALAALLRASSGTSSGGVTYSTSLDTSSVNDMNNEEKMLYLKVEQLRTTYMRLVEKLGHSADDALPDYVFHRMGLIDPLGRGRKNSEEFSLKITKKVALQLDEGKDDFTFSCTVLVIGKTGVGKSAAINSIFGEKRAFTDPFQPATTSVREISGVVDGVNIRIIDTPGLLPSLNDQRANMRILSSIKKYTRRCPPDVILYVDRVDTYSRDFNDLSILRMITSILGSTIWFNAIIALTHANLAFPDGPDGSSMSYEVVVAQRFKVVQQLICQAAEDSCLVNLMALVENHPSCRKNIDGESILPNGLRWRPWLLLLLYSSKIISELNSLTKLEIPSPKKLFPFHWPYPLSGFLPSRTQSKVQGGDSDNYDSDIDLDNMTKEVLQEDDEYDQLPHFKPLRKSYENDYQLKILQKMKLREELKRLKKMKGEKGAQDEQEANSAAVAIPLPDMVLPPSFDCKNLAHLYQFLKPRSRLLTRPVQHTHSWDHDCGYDSDESIDIAVQISKDNKEFTIHLDSIESKHVENCSTLSTFNIQPIGKQMAYSQFETKLMNLKKKRRETLVNGFKLDDQIFHGKKLCLVARTGALRAQRNIAYGVNLELCFMMDYPIGQAPSTLGLSMVKWGDFSVEANFLSEFSTGRNSKMAVRVGLNNRNNGQISIKTSATEQVHIALLGLLSLVLSICRNNWNSKTS